MSYVHMEEHTEPQFRGTFGGSPFLSGLRVHLRVLESIPRFGEGYVCTLRFRIEFPLTLEKMDVK